MKSVLKLGVKGLRAIAGENTALERFLEQQYDAVKSRIDKRHVGENFTLSWSGEPGENRLGIYMKGSCDVAATFASTPLIPSCSCPTSSTLAPAAASVATGSRNAALRVPSSKL